MSRENRIILRGTLPIAEALPIVGGKGGNLLRLTEYGADVPDFLILSSYCFQDFISTFRDEFETGLKNLDCSTPARIAETAAKLREMICSHDLPDQLRRELFEKIAELNSASGYFAVRSSALGEDSKEFSYAGMLDSFLFCKTEEQICKAILKCWASLYSDRAVSYRHMRNISQANIAMAVVVQEMVDGIASGVTFTVNPTTKYADEILITSVWGLGEGLVSGGVDSDQFVCLKDGYTIERRTIAKKIERVVFDRQNDSGTIHEKVPPEYVDKPSLNDEQIVQIAKVCHNIEKSYNGVPQDIEWTLTQSGKIKILQARPITTIDKPFPPERKYLTIWDNSNIIESYSGITTPLTFSFILDAYHSVYVQFCQVLGVSEEKILANDFAFANMLGLLNGRVYYNLKNWYRLVSVLPGFKYNSRFMEWMMGVKARFDLEEETSESVGFFRKYLIELPRLAYVGANLAWQFYTIDQKVERFMSIYNEMYNKYKDFDFNSAPAHKCVEIYNELVVKVLGNWKAPIINDFMAMIFYGILKMLIKAWNLDSDGSLQNDLLAGQGNVESTLPMKTLQKMARHIKSSPVLCDIFQKNDPIALKEMFVRAPRPDDHPEVAQLCTQINHYLAEFGYRSMNELKLEEPPLMERPDFIFSMLKNYISGKLPAEEDTSEKERLVREKAEAKVEEMLRGQKLYGLIPKIKVLKFVCEFAKKAVRFREYQRFARTKMYGLARRLFRGIGHRFVERGLLDNVDDIFYLKKDEIISYVVGSACSQKLRELARIRKAEFAEYAAMEDLPDRIETRGIVYTNDLTVSALKTVQADDPNLLQGIGGCSGVVRGKVKVILSPRDDMSLNGEILVTSKTDPGWVPLFASASGLLIERGSMLSHSVIVARELGLPTIVGITDLTKRLKTGDVVEMDGKTGLVKILERAPE